MKIKFLKLVHETFRIIARFASSKANKIYYKYLVAICPDCNGSGFELLFENNIRDCKKCHGDGYFNN